MIDSLSKLFVRDLDKLKTEIEAFQDEANLWKKTGSVINTSGTLALHLTGNLQHFIGAILGDSGYERDREFEFSGTPVDRAKLFAEIKKTKGVIVATLGRMTQNDLNAIYPLDVLTNGATTEQFVIHLYGHFNYHLGQINYLRRILEAPQE